MFFEPDIRAVIFAPIDGIKVLHEVSAPPDRNSFKQVREVVVPVEKN